jgi:hypothetical protein
MDMSTPLIVKSCAAPTPLGYSFGATQTGSIVSPRDTSSGQATGVRSSSIIAVLIG